MKSYDGYKLVRIKFNSAAAMDQLYAMNVDVWTFESTLVLNKFNDVLLSPQQYQELSNLFQTSNDANKFSSVTVASFEVVNDNVGATMKNNN